MQSLSRQHLQVGLVLLVAAIASAGTVQAQVAKPKEVSFQTFDGVKIQGALYPNPGGKRETVVMLLHAFDQKKGGSSAQPGWSELAVSLQKEGFSVLSFDFRGFGDSKTVDPGFWKHRHNNPAMGYIRPKGFKPNNPPTTIDHKEFNSQGLYLPYLLNDIAAAKAYLDRRNDAKELNSANVVVIGAGEGATLGAAWLANECRRKRDTTMPPAMFPAMAVLTPQTEIADIACGIWLSISPTLGNLKINNYTRRFLLEAGKKNKVPMAFIFGKGDGTGDGIARAHVQAIKPSSTAKILTGVFAVPDTKLTANLLLDKNLETEKWMLKKYIEPVLDGRGNKEQKDRKSEACQYWYINAKGFPIKICKKAGEESPSVDVNPQTIIP